MSAQAKAKSAILEAGEKAPTFELPTDEGNINTNEFLGKKNIVVYFYPKDDTPGCTTEGKDFSEHAEQFAAANTEIVGISKCSVDKHCKFKAKYGFNFALASDENSDVCEQFGVWVEKNMYGKKYMGIQRATFLINKEGIVSNAWPKVKVPGHVAEVLTAAKELA